MRGSKGSYEYENAWHRRRGRFSRSRRRPCAQHTSPSRVGDPAADGCIRFGRGIATPGAADGSGGGCRRPGPSSGSRLALRGAGRIDRRFGCDRHRRPRLLLRSGPAEPSAWRRNVQGGVVRMKKARFAIGGRVGWLAGLAVLVASLVFVGEAAAQPVYGIATGKQCAGPINVGDAYVCVASISNTNSTSLGTVTTNLVVDQVFHPDGTTAGDASDGPDQLEHGLSRRARSPDRRRDRSGAELRRDQVHDSLRRRDHGRPLALHGAAPGRRELPPWSEHPERHRELQLQAGLRQAGRRLPLQHRTQHLRLRRGDGREPGSDHDRDRDPQQRRRRSSPRSRQEPRSTTSSR